MTMKFCSNCGHAVQIGIPDGDNLPRHICGRCDTIHYQNPKIVTGCIPVFERRILLCRRAIEPRHGKWTLPAGFMENGETVAQAAMRETWEEARARVTDLELYGVFNIPHVNQVYIMFRGILEQPVFAAGEESLEVKLVTEEQVPWDELAFKVMHRTLCLYFDERRQARFACHMEDILPARRAG